MKSGSKNDFLKNTSNEKVPLPIIAFFVVDSSCSLPKIKQGHNKAI